MVKYVVSLDPELDGIAFLDAPHFFEREIQIHVHRSREHAAAGIAERSIRWRSQNTSLLDIASTVRTEKRCKSKALQLCVTRIGLLRGRSAGLIDWATRPDGSKCCAARGLPVAGNGDTSIAVEGGNRTAIVPSLPDSVVRPRNGVIEFTVADPIVGTAIVRSPGKAALGSQNATDLPALQHLPRRLFPRNLIGPRKPQAMTEIEVAAAVLIPNVTRIYQRYR